MRGGGIWTLSTRAWGAIFVVVISALGGWVGFSATRAVDHPLTQPGASTTGGASTGSDTELAAAALAIQQPPLLGQTAAEVLALLVVRDPDDGSEYQRTRHFGQAWLDVEGNGCSTREDILLRDLSDAVRNGCKVMSGTFVDPYSGAVTEFIRGNDTSSLVQIDHIVSLYNAWTMGAQHLTQDQRQRLANDPTNLLAVSQETNQSKGSGDAANWLPPFAAVHCEYAARQISVKFAYDLWVTSAEHDALADVLRTCPDQPAYRSWLPSATQPLGIAGLPPSTQTPPSTTVPSPPATSPEGDGGAVYYPNCAAAYAAGVSDILAGAPGYRPELDGDKDGIACEQ